MLSRTLVLVVFFFIGLPQIQGQCSCTGNVYFVDVDDDGHPDRFYSQDLTDAQEEFRRTCLRAQSAAVIVDCTQPTSPNTISSYNIIDCNDNDPNVWRTNTWYTDEDGDGAFGTYNSGCQLPPANSSGNVINL